MTEGSGSSGGEGVFKLAGVSRIFHNLYKKMYRLLQLLQTKLESKDVTTWLYKIAQTAWGTPVNLKKMRNTTMLC